MSYRDNDEFVRSLIYQLQSLYNVHFLTLSNAIDYLTDKGLYTMDIVAELLQDENISKHIESSIIERDSETGYVTSVRWEVKNHTTFTEMANYTDAILNWMGKYIDTFFDDIVSDFYSCPECGQLWRLEDMCEVRNNRICPHCKDNNYVLDMNDELQRVTDCEYVYDSDNQGIGYQLRTLSYFAQDMGRWYISNEHLYYDEDENCWNFNDHSQGDPNIYRYHYHDGMFKYIGVKRDDYANQLGIELEMVATDDNSRDDLAYLIAKDTNLFVFQTDSSIGEDGVECISNITSLDYLVRNKSKLESTFKNVVKNGGRSHNTNTCGLHIHINRRAFGDTQDEQTKTIEKVIWLTEKFKTEIEVFARRQANRYAQFRTSPRDDSDTKKRKIKETFNPPHHYYNINTNKQHTIEFRMFRGTLKINTIIMSIVLCKNLISIAKSRSENEIDNVIFDDVLGYDYTFEDNMRSYYRSRFGIGEE